LHGRAGIWQPLQELKIFDPGRVNDYCPALTLAPEVREYSCWLHSGGVESSGTMPSVAAPELKSHVAVVGPRHSEETVSGCTAEYFDGSGRPAAAA
jgi:hypothetical protein